MCVYVCEILLSLEHKIHIIFRAPPTNGGGALLSLACLSARPLVDTLSDLSPDFFKFHNYMDYFYQAQYVMDFV